MIGVFSKALKELRKKYNLSQKELAKELKVAPSTISMYEKGKRSPNDGLLKKIATYFDVSTDYLLGHIRKNETDSYDMYDYLEKIRSDRDMRALFELASKVNKDQLNMAIKFLKMMENE